MNLNMIIAPIVMVLVEALKKTEKVDSKFMPMIALSIGAVAGVVFAIVEPSLAVEHVINGLLYGGAAAGIYDASKTGLSANK